MRVFMHLVKVSLIVVAICSPACFKPNCECVNFYDQGGCRCDNFFPNECEIHIEVPQCRPYPCPRACANPPIANHCDPRIPKIMCELVSATFSEIQCLFSEYNNSIGNSISQELDNINKDKLLRYENITKRAEDDIQKAIDDRKQDLVQYVEEILSDSDREYQVAMESIINKAQGSLANKISSLLRLTDAEIVSHIRNAQDGTGPQLTTFLSDIGSQIKNALKNISEKRKDKIKAYINNTLCELSKEVRASISNVLKRIKKEFNRSFNKEVTALTQLFQTKSKEILKQIDGLLERLDGKMSRNLPCRPYDSQYWGPFPRFSI